MATSDSPLSVPNVTLAVARGSASSWVEGQPPVIQSVSGSFLEGQQATINVDNLSTKRDGQIKFENFEGDALGVQPASLDQSDASNTTYYLADDTQPYFGGKFARCVAVNEEPASAEITLAQDYEELYFEAWLRINFVDYDSLGDEQLKSWRIWTKATDPDGDTRNRVPSIIFSTNSGRSSTTASLPRDPNDAPAYYGSLVPNSAWMRSVLYWKKSDVGVANGKRLAKLGDREYFGYSDGSRFHSPNATQPDASWFSEGIVTNDGLIADGGSMEGSGLGRILLPYYTRSDQSTTIDADRIFINDSPERVVVGDASTWAACTPSKTFILPQASRSGNQVVVDVDTLGPLATGPAYLYVFNQDEQYNPDGYLWRAA